MAKNILVVDDNHLVAKSLSRLLESNGYAVDMAENGADALAVISRKVFDLVILDIRMPGIDGVETAQKIKEYLKQNNKKGLPLIFITGYADEKASKDAKALNASDFIYKPFDKELFLKSIERAIENK